MTEIASYEDWRKLEFRVAEVLEAQEHPEADKLLILKVKIGSEERTIVAGIKQHYKPKDLVGKKVIVVANLQPRTLRGIISEGMVLAAVDGDQVVLLQPEKDIPSGAKVQ
ncbi:MAG TPA: methionine--tRNA ligase subunit beta [Candidatus Nanoarchaeia archaeon]|nr:methionine--tRNA ligase subunit beta [Candidatus Nanoarchaeia archaeon]